MPCVHFVVLPSKVDLLIPDIEVKLFVCSFLEYKKVIGNRGCGQREKAVFSTEVCKGPEGITKTLSVMMVFIVRDTVARFIHFAYSSPPETDSDSPQILS